MDIFDQINWHHEHERAARTAAAAALTDEKRAVYLASADRHAKAAWEKLQRVQSTDSNAGGLA